MKTLTKTQTALLLKSRETRTGRIYTVLVSGHGSDGGRASYGARDSAAACKLRDAGLITFVQHEESRDIQNGWHKVFRGAIWELTDAGRAVLASLPA